MGITALLTILFFIFLAVDTYLYAQAKYPERTSSWLYKLPGGGLAALLKYGRDTDKP